MENLQLKQDKLNEQAGDVICNPEEEHLYNPFDEDLPDQDYIEEADQEEDIVQNEEDDQDVSDVIVERKTRKKVKKNHDVNDSDDSSNMENVFDQNVIMDKLPTDKNRLHNMLSEVKGKIRTYQQVFFNQQSTLSSKKSYVTDNCVPICTDITKFDFDNLIETQLKIANRQFDVLMMDPPWRLSTSQPSRGVAIQYQSLSDQLIEKIPVEKLQKSGFLFVWVINAKFQWTVNTMEKKWGYKVIDTINWIKKTVNGKIAKGHGFYLQHAKQTCLVGYKGDFQNYKKSVSCDVIFSDRRGQSQKPTQIYEYIQELVPNGYYLQVFGRRNNLRQNWVTIGNQL